METFLQSFLQAGQDGLRLIASAVLPVLFPFFVLTTLILNLSNNKQPWLVIILAYISGYPNGARLTQSLYLQKRIGLKQAQHLAILTSTPSPMFAIATVGMIFFKNLKLGFIMFLCTIIAALWNGWLWRPNHCQPSQKQILVHEQAGTKASLFQLFSDAIKSATTAIINVCGVILFFYIFARLCQLPPLLAGILEMTTGVASTANPILVQFLLAFGGLSVGMQQQLFMQSYQLKFRTYIIQKITHGLLASALLTIYLLFLN